MGCDSLGIVGWLVFLDVGTFIIIFPLGGGLSWVDVDVGCCSFGVGL